MTLCDILNNFDIPEEQKDALIIEIKQWIIDQEKDDYYEGKEGVDPYPDHEEKMQSQLDSWGI